MHIETIVYIPTTCWVLLQQNEVKLQGCYYFKNFSVGVSCGQLVDPSNGRVNTSAGTSFGDVARYSCDRGYTLNGPAERTCHADAQWSGSAPTCERELVLCQQSSWSYVYLWKWDVRVQECPLLLVTSVCAIICMSWSHSLVNCCRCFLWLAWWPK